MPMTAREAAFKALTAHKKTGVWTDAVLNSVLTRENIGQRDAALAARIFYGVVQNLALCDFYISSFSTVKLYKMQPQVLNILRLSIYQLVFLTKIPANAAVSEGVELAKQFANPRAASFVNAVLRKISANLKCLPPVKANTEAERLSVLYSHPEWLVRAFIEQLGIDGAEQLLKMNNEPVAMTAMVNTCKEDVSTVLSALSEDGVLARKHTWLKDALELTSTHRPDRLQAFQDGWIYIQDPAAALAVVAADPKPDMFVVDGCAAPGGKSFTAAVMMWDKGRVLSCDLTEKKVQKIRDGVDRLGLKSVEPTCMNARVPDDSLFEKADIVIADVPCSGLGVIRKKPEIRYKNPEEFRQLPSIQLDILSNLSNYVRPGGVLLYSTCTLLKSENEEVVEAFLNSNKQFKPERFSLPEPVGNVKAGSTTLWPHIHETDGFFICRLRRTL